MELHSSPHPLLKKRLGCRPEHGGIMVADDIGQPAAREARKARKSVEEIRMPVEDPPKGPAGTPLGVKVGMHTQVIHLDQIEDVSVEDQFDGTVCEFI